MAAEVEKLLRPLVAPWTLSLCLILMLVVFKLKICMEMLFRKVDTA